MPSLPLCVKITMHTLCFMCCGFVGFQFSAFATASKKPTFSFKQRGTEAKPGHFKDH